MHSKSISGQPHSLWCEIVESTTPKSSAVTGARISKQPLPFCASEGPSYSTVEPSLPLLYKLGVPEQVGVGFKKFGTLLLNDGTGAQVNSIEEEFRDNHEKITTRILEEWLKGEGLSVTWEVLLDTLQACKLNTLADQIQTALPTMTQ